MELLPALDEQALVGDILDHRVLEDVGRLGQEPLLVDDLERLQFLKESLQLAGESRDALQRASQELTADHRGELHGPLAVLAEPVEARHDDVVEWCPGPRRRWIGLTTRKAAVLTLDECRGP